MSEGLRPIVTILERSKPDDATVQTLKDAGYCVLVVKRHDDVQPVEILSGPAHGMMRAAIFALRESYGGAGKFSLRVAEQVLESMGLPPLEPKPAPKPKPAS